MAVDGVTAAFVVLLQETFSGELRVSLPAILNTYADIKAAILLTQS